METTYSAAMQIMLAALVLVLTPAPPDMRLHLLFLGDRAYHQPEVRLHEVWGTLARRGIVLDWEDDLTAVTPTLLADYDCVLMYANHPDLPHEPATFSQALDDYIRTGGGFAALHCTSGCFMDSPDWLALIGARFTSHGSEVFAQEVVNPEHPITRDWTPFETWDETYVQQHVRDNRTLLTTRGDEPWCWTRSLGDGRIFYTASGHDHRTWTHPGWVDHLERAIVWAAGPLAASRHSQFKPVEFDFEPHDWVPNYEAHDPPMPFQLASTPEQATAALIPAAGFHAELFASEPLIVNPVAMTWDERGRCWVIESPDYPNDTRDDGVGTDRISVLEDTDGDGMADSKTVFAENLNLPTGLLKVTGGLIVASPPHLLFYEDVDGDDQADRRATLLTGFGTWDTHAGPSNLAWGPDNNVWGAIGYAGYKSEDGPTFASGLWRWDQAKSQPEFVAQFTNNTWGLGLRSDGEVFGSTANGAPSFFVGAPKPSTLASSPQQAGAEPAFDSTRIHAALPQLQQGDFMGQFTAAAGHHFATGSHVPAHWPERMAFIAEPTAHLVGRQEAYPSESGYRVRDCFNLVASTDEWFCPVQAEVGPDGAIWIADLGQFIIMHNLPGNPERGLPSVSFGDGNAHRNPLRDNTHGRIFRIVSDAPLDTTDLSNARPDQLVAALAHANRFWRTTARRLLVEGMYIETAEALHDLAREDNDFAAAEAIRTLHGLGALGGRTASATLQHAMQHGGPAARHAALDSLPANGRSIELMLNAGILDHINAATRRRAYLAAARLPESPAMGAALAGRVMMESPTDPWFPTVITAAAVAHADAFVAAASPLLSKSEVHTVFDTSLRRILDTARSHADGAARPSGQRTIDLSGGDAAAGKQVFLTNTIAACFRCHSLDGSGTGVGPDLSLIGSQLAEDEILVSILDPNASLAETWTAPMSAMPALGAFLSDSDIRDLVAFLVSQQ
jgi:putative membrane-bound dehydrogenase-like protein